jgi:hypothetical protein
MAKKSTTEEDYLKLSKSDKYLVFLIKEDNSGNLDNISVIRNNINYFEELGVMLHHQHSLVTELAVDKAVGRYISGVQQEVNNMLVLNSLSSEGTVKH